MKILVVVPAYNEATTIEGVLRAMQGVHDVVVIDDGSTDNTGEVARASGALTLRHVVNRGLGAALRTGFAYALSRGDTYDAVITLDADGQHNPAEIENFIAALDAGAEVIIGRREFSDMPRIRQAYNAAGAIITSALFGGPFTDSQSGFRAFQVTKLRDFRLMTSRMEISSEIIAEAYRVGAKIQQIPITIAYTEYSMSKGQGFFEGLRTLWRLVLKSFA
jgi:glycosyltransferase involved in cell wall biosynthesis